MAERIKPPSDEDQIFHSGQILPTRSHAFQSNRALRSATTAGKCSICYDQNPAEILVLYIVMSLVLVWVFDCSSAAVLISLFYRIGLLKYLNPSFILLSTCTVK